MAEEIINTGNLGKSTVKSLITLIKYYKHINMNKEQIRDTIENFMKNNYGNFNTVKWQETLDKLVRKYSDDKYKLIQVNGINITEKELKHIESINNLKLEKLAFILLVYCKYTNEINENNNNWVNEKHNEYFKEGKIYANTREQCLLLNDLSNLGLIHMTKNVSGSGINVKFVNEDSDISITITDHRELILNYLKWKGENIGCCDECGKLIIQTKNVKKYCNKCAKKIKLEQNRIADRKYKEKIKKRENEKVPLGIDI